MRRLKLTLTDMDGIVLEQYEVRNQKELDQLADHERDNYYNVPNMIYVNLDRPDEQFLDEVEFDIGVYLVRS